MQNYVRDLQCNWINLKSLEFSCSRICHFSELCYAVLGLAIAVKVGFSTKYTKLKLKFEVNYYVLKS